MRDDDCKSLLLDAVRNDVEEAMRRDEAIHQLGLAVTNHLLDQGCLIEAGFAAFAHFTIPPDAPQEDIDKQRFAFMAGAEHLFSSVMAILDEDEGNEPTADDLRRMRLIEIEIAKWRRMIDMLATKAKGSA